MEHSAADSDHNDASSVRQTLAYVLAQAVFEFCPAAQLGSVEVTDDGFYHDFLLPRALSPDDFPELERRMRRILAAPMLGKIEALGAADALARLAQFGQPYQQQAAAAWLETRPNPGAAQLSLLQAAGLVQLCAAEPPAPSTPRAAD